MTCISSIPLNKKSIKKQVNATTTNDNIVYKTLLRSIGIVAIITNKETKATKTNMSLATSVSPTTSLIAFLSPCTLTISFVADNKKPKSTTICIYCMTAFTYETTP